jgi:hypothetical protein
MPHPKPPPIAPSSPDDIEQQFYEALQHGDIEALMAAWADDDDILCVHPGGPPFGPRSKAFSAMAPSTRSLSACGASAARRARCTACWSGCA